MLKWKEWGGIAHSKGWRKGGWCRGEKGKNWTDAGENMRKWRKGKMEEGGREGWGTNYINRGMEGRQENSKVHVEREKGRDARTGDERGKMTWNKQK